MSEQNNESGTQNNGGSTGYSAEYVKQLREEAATWRTKFREVEDKVSKIESERTNEQRKLTVQEEFTKRGIQGVNPSWVNISEGMTPALAVDNFLKEYPHLASSQSNEDEIKPRNTRKPMPSSSDNTNIENTAKSELSAIKKDPVAREKLRGLYRSLLAMNSKSSYSI